MNTDTFCFICCSSANRKRKNATATVTRKKAKKARPTPTPADQQVENVNVDMCVVCGQGGSLLCCDGCPAAYHGHCFEPPVDPDSMLPDEEWYCPDCEDLYKRIPVWCPGKTGVLRGKRAPFKKDLPDWLKQNPGFRVWVAKDALKFNR